MAKRKHKIDFTGVESFNKPAEGKHKAKIKKVEETTSAGGNDMFKVTFEVVSGESKGCRVIDNYPLVDTALWKLKSLLQAIGMKADGRVQVDLDKMENKVLEIKVFYEDYNGQERAKIGETNKFISKSEDNDFEDDDIEDDDIEDDEDDEDDEEIEEKKPSKKKKSKATNTKKQDEKENEKKEESDDDVDDDDFDDWDDDDWED